MTQFDAMQADAMARFQRRPDVIAADVAARQQMGAETHFTPMQLKLRKAQERYQAACDAAEAERLAKA